MSTAARIRRDIEQAIHSGALRPGARIPFEHELVAQYGCARATVSKALASLADAGLIERRRKAGSFVAHPHVQTAVLAVPDLEKLIRARGEAYRWRRTGRGMAGAAELASTGFAGPALQVVGVHYGGADPFALERRLIALATVPEAAAEDFSSQAPGGWLLAHIPWTRARHTIAAVAASAEEAGLLNIAAGTACLALTRRTWRMDAPVTLVRQLFPGDRYDLVAEFDPGGSGSVPF